jgi:hypothetical protein
MKISKRIIFYFKITPFKKIPKEVFFRFCPRLAWKINKRQLQRMVHKLQKKDKEFILEIRFGGLGDHLVFSAFPEFFSKKFNIKFRLSSHSIFGNEETKNIVWRDNPYVEFVDTPGKELACPRIDKYKNYNDAFADIFELGEEYQKMKIYYQPKKMDINEEDILCDLTFGRAGGHNGYKEKIFEDSVVNYLRNNFNGRTLILLMPEAEYANKSIVSAVMKSGLKYKVQPVKNLNRLADFLYSYPTRILLYSGAASLAVAINCKATVLCNELSDPYFQYNIHDYISLIKKE